MTSERKVLRARAAQVGFVMRAYREAFLREDGRRGLSQDELLYRMDQEDPIYAHRYSHATVSRWESGSTLPSEHRIQVFGRTLGLSGIEVSGLISMAGLEIDSGPDSQNAASGAASLAVDQPELADREQGPEARGSRRRSVSRTGLGSSSLSGFCSLGAWLPAL